MRRRVRVGLVLLLLLTATVACRPGGAERPSGAGSSGGTAAASAQIAPAGWRWESFRDVELAVPPSWGYGVSGTPWCRRPDGAAPAPYVGRPGDLVKPGCPVAGATSAAVGGTFVWLEGAVAAAERVVGGDRTAITRGSVDVVVQAPRALREQILTTVRSIGIDVNGCPATHPISRDPDWRPRPFSAALMAPPRAVAACRYGVGGPGPALFSSVRITGDTVPGLLVAISQGAAVRNGRPVGCRASVAVGQEVIVLRFGPPPDLRQVVMRYAGCAHDGFDDGSAVRPLTRAKVIPFVAGPNATDVAAPGMEPIRPS